MLGAEKIEDRFEEIEFLNNILVLLIGSIKGDVDKDE